MSEELKACPFCGGEARIDSWGGFAVECSNCHCRTDRWSLSETGKDQAITAWNTRATDAENQRLRAEVREAEANINLKAEFIEATLNQMAQKDQDIDELRVEVEALREAYDELRRYIYDKTAERREFVITKHTPRLTRKAPQ